MAIFLIAKDYGLLYLELFVDVTRISSRMKLKTQLLFYEMGSIFSKSSLKNRYKMFPRIIRRLECMT